MTRRLVLVGIGPGDPEQVTFEAARALQDVSFVLATSKREDDPLLAVRRAILERHAPGADVVVVDDPDRDRSSTGTRTSADYEGAVLDWHEARARAWVEAIGARTGDVGFLVWGDPAFYDSTIRVLDRVAPLLDAELVVIPGVSSLQLFAARHRIVLHEIGQPIHLTTGRRLPEAVAQGQDNVVVWLSRSLDELREMDPAGWTLWWGANLGAPSERLVHGPLADVLDDVQTARDAAKADAGWVMDLYLIRRVS